MLYPIQHNGNTYTPDGKSQTLPENPKVCTFCGKTIAPTSGIAPGYAMLDDIDDNRTIVCYACCADVDRQAMEQTGHAVLYLSPTKIDKGSSWKVTNWPSTLVFAAWVKTNPRGHFVPGYGYTQRQDVWFATDDGRLWHGRCLGHNTQLTWCKRLKDTPNNRRDALTLRGYTRRLGDAQGAS